MIRFLIRIAALVIIAGSVYVVKNVGKTDVSKTQREITEEKTEILELAKLDKEVDESIKKIEKFTKKDEADSSISNKPLILKKIVNPINKKVVNTNIASRPKTTTTKLIEMKKVNTAEVIEKVWPKSAGTVYMYDFEIDLSKRKFPVGDITFTVKNSGLFAHQFAIEGIKNYGLVGRNTTENFTVRITKPGEYKILSAKEMDIEREMYEYIVVE